jgi:hypothetical protein
VRRVGTVSKSCRVYKSLRPIESCSEAMDAAEALQTGWLTLCVSRRGLLLCRHVCVLLMELSLNLH